MSSPTSWPTSASTPAAATVEADLGYGPIDNAIHVQPQRVARREVRSQVRRGELRLEQCQSTVGAESSDGTNLLCHLVDAARLPNSKAGQNCEEMLTEQAERVLKEDPGIVGEQPRVWIYRNTIKGLNWFTSVREKLEDPSYAGWFVRFANYRGPQSNGSYHVPACTFEKCSGFCACRFPLLHVNRLSYLRFAADAFVADHDQLQTPELGGSLHNGGCKEECDCGKAPCGEYIFGPSHLPIVCTVPQPTRGAAEQTIGTLRLPSGSSTVI